MPYVYSDGCIGYHRHKKGEAPPVGQPSAKDLGKELARLRARVRELEKQLELVR